MRPLAAPLVVALLLLGAASCATHTTTLRSVPSDADVYVLDEEDRPTAVGRTPMQLPLGYGVVGRTETFLVASGEKAMRFSIVRGRVTPASAGNAAVTTTLTSTLCGSVAVLSGVLGFLSLPLVPTSFVLAPAAFCLSGCAGLVVALQPGVCLFTMWAPPDVVEVRLPDEEEGEAASFPRGLIEDVEVTERPPDTPRAPRQPRAPGTGPIEIRY